MDDDYAIIVGIKDYPEFPQLNGPVRDAQCFYDWVVSEKGGRVPTENAKLIVSTRSPPAATVADAEPTLEMFEQAITPLVTTAYTNRTHRVGHRLYLYFAGHGLLPSRAQTPNLNDAALLMANSSLHFLGYHIPGYPYAEWFRVAGAFDEIILLMDCCREDFPNIHPRAPGMTELKGDMDRVKYLYGVAAQFGAEAREKPIGTPPEVRGLFSYALMETLNGGSGDEQDNLTASILAGNVIKRVKELSDPSNPQEPKFFMEPAKDFVIAAAAGATINVSIDIPLAARNLNIELVDGRLALITPPSPIMGVETVRVPLSAGIYGLRRAGQTSPSTMFAVAQDSGPIHVAFT